MPNVEVVYDVSQHFPHVAGNGSMAVWNESRYQNSIAQQILDALLKTHELHGWATACLVSLENIKQSNKISWWTYVHLYVYSEQPVANKK